MKAFLKNILIVIFLQHNGVWSQGFNSDEFKLKQAYTKEVKSTKKFLRLLKLGNFYLSNDVIKADSIRFSIIEASRFESESDEIKAQIFDLKVEHLLGNKSAYLSKILQLQTHLSKVNSDEDLVQVLLYKIEYHIENREFDLAELFLTETDKIAKRLRSYSFIAETNKLYALLYKETNKSELALRHAEVAIQYAKRSSNKTLMTNCVNVQAQIYNYFGQVEISVSKNFIALQLAKEALDYPLIAQIQLEIGESQLQIFNYENANSFFIQAKETALKIKDKRLEALVEIDLALYKQAKHQYKEAREKLLLALKLLEQFQDENSLGLAHKYLGNLYNEQKEYEIALRYYNQAMVNFESASNRSEIANVYYLVGTVFSEQKKYQNALNYLNRSVEIRTELGHISGTYLSYKEIAEVYRKLGNTNKAYQYLNLYTQYSDSARVVEIGSKIAELSVLYKAEQREQLIAKQASSIELQRKEKENSELRNKFQTYIIIGFIIFVLLGAIIVYSRWKQRDIKQMQREAEMNQTLLRSQMNPHFVFNAMSVIQSYIYENDTKNSSKFLINFSKLMRLILENSSKEFIPIKTEIDILEKYLNTQKLRFGDRFTYSVNVADKLLEDEVLIPPMITQPFIENALEHGQLHTIENGNIQIKFTFDESMLHVLISDNGIGRKGAKQNKKSSEHRSMAMKITQDRIQNLSYKYKIQGRMEIADFDKVNETGTIVNIYLPYKTES